MLHSGHAYAIGEGRAGQQAESMFSVFLFVGKLKLWQRREKGEQVITLIIECHCLGGGLVCHECPAILLECQAEINSRVD